MAQHSDTDLTPPAPALLAPRDMAVIDGREVTFSWKPVAEATGYLLEVARDTGFADIVHSEELADDTTSQAVAETLDADGETFFWRVLARNGEVWSNGDHVESFICCRDEATLAARLGRPHEALGPSAALFGSAAREARNEVSGSSADIALEEMEEGVEHEGVEAGQILGIAIAILAGIGALVIAGIVLTQTTSRDTYFALFGEYDYPLIQEVRVEDERLLTQYGVVDEDQGLYRIPIDRAMALMLMNEQAEPAGGWANELEPAFRAPGARLDGAAAPDAAPAADAATGSEDGLDDLQGDDVDELP